jgi:isoquinoline 1-oxidoreductase
MTTAPAAREGLAIVGPVGIGFPPPRTGYAAAAYGGATPTDTEATWLVVRPDGGATAFAGKVEYGQGIRTGFAVEVADELRLPLPAVDVILADTDLVPWDMGTFGSQSTARVGLTLRKAAATARQALLELAADRLDLPVADLEARDGRVISRSDANNAATYAQLLAGRQIERRIEDDAPLTPASEFTVMGRPAQRVDAVARVTGQAIYSQDVLVPGMLFARVVRPPSYGATLEEFDGSAAERAPGVVAVVHDGSLAAVLAENDEAADLGERLVRATWKERTDHPGRWEIPQLLLSAEAEAITTQETGSLDDGFREAAHILEATYYVPYISNAPMEPRAAVAQWEGEHLTVWAGSQRPFGVRAELAQRFGIDEALVHVITPEVGGGFGGKSIYPVAIEAARLAKLAGRPVRVAYTRTEETVWATFRPAALIEIRSGFTADGRLVAWSFAAHHAAKSRPMIGRRGSETPYDVANAKVTVGASDGPLPAGSYRSLGGAVNHFAREVHMDEIAAAVGLDPVELRLRNLSHPRFRRVLERAASDFGWTGAKQPSGRGVGVAVGLDVGSYAATCVELDVQGSEVKVSRVSAAVDCGLVVNPDGATNQVEGSIVMGLGTALYEAIDVAGGRVLNPGFTRYRVPRITNAPAIGVALVGDPETPSSGAGEPGIVPLAPAVANAVFDRTGQRLRELPLQRHLP